MIFPLNTGYAFTSADIHNVSTAENSLSDRPRQIQLGRGRYGTVKAIVKNRNDQSPASWGDTADLAAMLPKDNTRDMCTMCTCRAPRSTSGHKRWKNGKLCTRKTGMR